MEQRLAIVLLWAVLVAGCRLEAPPSTELSEEGAASGPTEGAAETTTAVTATGTVAGLAGVDDIELPTPADPVLAHLVEWLECEDYCEDELDAVMDRGPEVQDDLARFLQDGPPPERQDALEQHLRRSYRELAQYLASREELPLRRTEEEYVRAYVANYVAGYRIRAAYSLAALGDPASAEIIEAALEATDGLGTFQRADVQAALQEALAQLTGRP